MLFFFPIFICSQSPTVQSAFAYLVLLLSMQISGCTSTVIKKNLYLKL